MSSRESMLGVKRTMDESFASLFKKLVTPNEAYVRRTPHVGAWPVNNLICAAYGIPCHLVDINVIGHDSIYLNENNDEVRRILETNNALPGTPTSLYPTVVDSFVSPLKKLFPKTEIITNTELYKKLGEKFDLDKILQSVMDVSIERGMWKRYVGEDGHTHEVDDEKKASLTKEMIREGGIYGISEAKKGWILPNEVALLVESVLLAAMKGANATYELAGRDMHLYVGGIAESLRALYEALQKEMKGTGQIDDRHDIIVSTTLGHRFATLATRKKELIELTDGIKEYRSLLRRRKNDERFGVLAARRLFAQKMNNHDEMDRIDVVMGVISKEYQGDAKVLADRIETQLFDFPDLVATAGFKDAEYDLDQFKLEALQGKLDTLEQIVDGEVSALYVLDDVCKDMPFSEINKLLKTVDFLTDRRLEGSPRDHKHVAMSYRGIQPKSY